MFSLMGAGLPWSAHLPQASQMSAWGLWGTFLSHPWQPSASQLPISAPQKNCLAQLPTFCGGTLGPLCWYRVGAWFFLGNPIWYMENYFKNYSQILSVYSGTWSWFLKGQHRVMAETTNEIKLWRNRKYEYIGREKSTMDFRRSPKCIGEEGQTERPAPRLIGSQIHVQLLCPWQ